MSLLIYGVTGFTGALVSRTASAYGIQHIVAARSPEGVQHASQLSGLEGRAFDLEDPREVAKWLAGVTVVLNCAGPFSETADPLAKACMLVGAHYLDISATASDHLAISALEGQAIQAGIMLMPGVGASLMPSDCLAKLALDKIKNPTHLTLAFHSEGKSSKGVVSSLLHGMSEPGVLRSNGKLQTCYPGVKERKFKMGGKPVSMLTDPWRAEQVGVFRSTGIRNIETYTNFSKSARFMLKVPGQLESGAMKWFVERTIRKTAKGPSDKELAKSTTCIYAEVKNKEGDQAALSLLGPGIFQLTGLSAISCAYAATEVKVRPGYQTPARAFGADLISKVQGVQIIE